MPVQVKALYAQYPTQNRKEYYTTLPEACLEDAPSLVLVDREYGEGVSVLWLVVQLIEVMKFTNLLDKFRPFQLEATAKQLREMGFHVTMPEFMVFFQRFEQGYYEQFLGYERPNAQVITRSFKQFLNDVITIREQQYEQREAQERAIQEAQWKEKAVPCPPETAEKLERLRKNFGK